MNDNCMVKILGVKGDVYKWGIFYKKSSVVVGISFKHKDLFVSNPHIKMENEEESTAMTLGADVSLKTAYNRLKLVQRHMIRMDMIAKSKSPLIDANRMKWVILTTTAPVMYILKDLGEFLEILNQQQVQKEKRKQYRNKKKTLKKQQTEVKS